MNYDIIGDIHGYSDALEQLLQKLGYKRNFGVYSHPEGRKVIFVGDFIDRGPKIRETLHLVKDMVDTGNALAVMGNHEFNAVCFHTPHLDSNAGFFRDHSVREIEQHLETLRQFKHYSDEWNEFLTWFKSLPMYLDLPECRIVHAFWKDEHIQWLKENYITLDQEFLFQCSRKGTIAHKVVEETLKGAEASIPNGGSFLDKDGNRREECRIKWWSNKREFYGDVFMECPPEIEKTSIDTQLNLPEYCSDIPVFFGHYWLKGIPKIENKKSICLDYSIAKNGKLVAYSLNEGLEINEKLLSQIS